MSEQFPRDIASVEKDFFFQKKQWKINGFLKMLLGLFCLAGILGLFGNGIFSERRLEGRDFSIIFEKFARVETPSTIRLIIKKQQPSFSIKISEAFFEKIHIVQVLPAPSNATFTDEGVEYQFSSPHQHIILYAQPDKMGTVKGTVTMGAEKLFFNQFIYF